MDYFLLYLKIEPKLIGNNPKTYIEKKKMKVYYMHPKDITGILA